MSERASGPGQRLTRGSPRRRSPRAPGFRSLFVVAALFAVVACGPWSSDQGQRGDADTETIYTGRPGEFYILDYQRRLCFFYSVIYGRYDFAQVDCAQVPEARERMALDPRMSGGISDGADELPVDTYTDAQWEAFQLSYMDISCLREGGERPDLASTLVRNGLDETSYRAMLALASSDPAFWTQLSRGARARCAEGGSAGAATGSGGDADEGAK